MKYALIDTANTFFRARHVANRNTDTWEKIGMAMHLTMSSVNQVQRMFGVDHVVFCLEGRSWRKDFYTPYKAHRKLDESAMTEREVEENKMFWETYEQFTTFLTLVYCVFPTQKQTISLRGSLHCILTMSISLFRPILTLCS